MFIKKLTTLDRRPQLYLNTVVGKGRGVFCYEDIKAGEVLEVAPVMVINERDSKRLWTTTFEDYCFGAGAFPDSFLASAGIAAPEEALCLVMGMGSFCNHLRVPNAKPEFMVEGVSALCVLTAVQDIPKGTEICISYGIAWFGGRKPGNLARRKAEILAAEEAEAENQAKSTGSATPED